MIYDGNTIFKMLQCYLILNNKSNEWKLVY